MLSLRKNFNQLARRVTAGAAIILLSPLFASIAIGVYADMRKNVIYKQKRYGKNKKKFVIYKFSTLVDEPKNFGREVHGQERITKFGYFLRRTGLDELPQLFNIFKGEMNFIGPRPVVYKVSKKQEQVYDYLPGIISPKSGTHFRRISNRNKNFRKSVVIGAKIEIRGMQTLSLRNRFNFIYKALRLNYRENHCGFRKPKYAYGTHPRLRFCES